MIGNSVSALNPRKFKWPFAYSHYTTCRIYQLENKFGFNTNYIPNVFKVYNQVAEDDMGWLCSTNGGEEERL
jgi:hypothetical protein